MRIAILLLSLLFTVSTQAVTLDNLYQGVQPVENQSNESRQQGIVESFKQVLVKVSGSSASLTNPLLVAQFNQANAFVSSFSYRFDEEQDQLYVEVSFSPKGVNTALRQAGEPVWGSSRPLILLLLVAESDEGIRDYVQNQDELGVQVYQQMVSRGLPALFPLWDLEDEITLPVSNLWGQFDADINRLAERYTADAYLVGRLSKLEEMWTYEGAITENAQRYYIQQEAPSKEELLTQLTEKVAKTLSAKYSLADYQGSALSKQIRIQGVSDFVQYRQLQDYLANHHAAQSVTLVKLEQDTVVLKLGLSDSWDKTWQVLMLDKRLIPTSEADTFRWQN